MDIQLKKGLLEYCVLAVLVKGDSYGYQMIKDISVCIDIFESTLYQILKRLESCKYLQTRTAEHNGRLRKYYKITQAGRKALEEFITSRHEVTKVYDFIIQSAKND